MGCLMVQARLAELNLDPVNAQSECSMAAKHLITAACCREEHRTRLQDYLSASAMQGELQHQATPIWKHSCPHI